MKIKATLKQDANKHRQRFYDPEARNGKGAIRTITLNAGESMVCEDHELAKSFRDKFIITPFGTPDAEEEKAPKRIKLPPEPEPEVKAEPEEVLPEYEIKRTAGNKYNVVNKESGELVNTTPLKKADAELLYDEIIKGQED